jgi:hypothetical protein
MTTNVYDYIIFYLIKKHNWRYCLDKKYKNPVVSRREDKTCLKKNHRPGI